MQNSSFYFPLSLQIPVCASIWSCSSVVMTFSAYLVLSFLRNHKILEVDFCIHLKM